MQIWSLKIDSDSGYGQENSRGIVLVQSNVII